MNTVTVEYTLLILVGLSATIAALLYKQKNRKTTRKGDGMVKKESKSTQIPSQNEIVEMVDINNNQEVSVEIDNQEPEEVSTSSSTEHGSSMTEFSLKSGYSDSK
ncbi:unnamed protein product [Auanema sp. JU1783]|nr:unnamed protein product [Auanema sp. JU1783]